MSFSMKEGDSGGFSERAPADLTPFEGLDPATWLTGKVASTVSFGAFVNVKAPDSDATASGLVHITQIREGFVENVEEELQAGQEVQVRVVGVDNGKMSLTMKSEDAEDYQRGERAPADLTPFEGLDPATWLTGNVVSTTSFGAFVDVKAPDSDATANGLVHITQIKDGFVESVEDELEVGQEVEVRVISVEDGKMSLTMKSEDAE